jgi:hypothetical protein
MSMNMTQGQQIAGAGGVLLVICLFLAWYDPLSGWESFSTFDVYLLITAGVAIAWAVLGEGPTNLTGVTRHGAAALLGVIGLVLLLWLLIFDWPDGVDRGIGALLAIPATGAIFYGASRGGA